MIKYTDKYHLSPEESLFLAKKGWDQNVHCGMKMENRAVTFPQTKTILEGVNVPSVQLDDIQAILNMRDAWKYLLKTINSPTTLEYACKLNEYIARNESLEWGKLRTGFVSISGTYYIPPVPNIETVVSEFLGNLSPDLTITNQALTMFTWGIRSQLFWDGNKRTSLLLANKILLQSGAGMLTVKEKHMEKFNFTLLEYYGSGNAEALKQFLYDTSLQGIDF
jgi:hypothetical protein